MGIVKWFKSLFHQESDVTHSKNEDFSTKKEVKTKPGKVRFVRKYTQTFNDGSTAYYEIYKASKPQTAKEFLKTKTVTEPMYYIICETDDGNWGMDKEGLFLERLLSWQLDTSEYDCMSDGIASLSWSHFSLTAAAQKRNDNFVARVICGSCSCEWEDGIRYQNKTVCKCPNCGKKNLVDSTNVKVLFVQS